MYTETPACLMNFGLRPNVWRTAQGLWPYAADAQPVDGLATRSPDTQGCTQLHHTNSQCCAVRSSVLRLRSPFGRAPAGRLTAFILALSSARPPFGTLYPYGGYSEALFVSLLILAWRRYQVARLTPSDSQGLFALIFLS